MKRNLVVMSAMVMAAAMVSASSAHAASTTVRTGVDAIYAKVKMVRFTLQSNCSEPMKLMIGDKEVTLLPGKPLQVNVADGQKIVAEAASGSHKAGDVIAVAGTELQDATVTVQ